MAITDINISEQLETSAPSIKYRGNEGPKSPKEQMMMAGPDRYFKILEFKINELESELGRDLTDEEYEAVSEEAFEEFHNQAGGQPLPQDPTKPVNPFAPKPTGPVLPDKRQMAAFGGIMGRDGRRRYGLGSLKRSLRKLIPNEIAQIAETAAPFVAPFNPLAAGLMSGIGGFDRTGRIGSSLKSGLMNYGLGQAARYLGGADLQKGLNLRIGEGTGFGSFFSKPTGTNKRFFDDMFKSKTAPVDKVASGVPESFAKASNNVHLSPDEQLKKWSFMSAKDKAKYLQQPNLNFLDKALNFAKDNKLLTAAGIYGVAKALTPEETVSAIMDRGEGMDVESIRAEVREAFADPSGEKLAALRVKYPYLGRADTKDMAYGGRIGKAEGGLMDLGGMEKDYRNTGGFVDLGAKEKADDVPARLSVNEFVFTADAVRNAGGGDIDKGAEVMENMMKHLEQGGQVSDESQGLAGAQQMFETSERLSEVI